MSRLSFSVAPFRKGKVFGSMGGVNGWLVPPGDSHALADAIREALSDSQRLTHMGAEGREIVEREFSWSVVVDRLLGVYDDLLA